MTQKGSFITFFVKNGLMYLEIINYMVSWAQSCIIVRSYHHIAIYIASVWETGNTFDRNIAKENLKTKKRKKQNMFLSFI